MPGRGSTTLAHAYRRMRIKTVLENASPRADTQPRVKALATFSGPATPLAENPLSPSLEPVAYAAAGALGESAQVTCTRSPGRGHDARNTISPAASWPVA